jgi:Xaa-Pro aminopeptidase
VNVSERIERLRQQLEEPFLVTEPVNVRYLTGFQSTNAAVVVDDGAVRLFADFRYAELGREVPGVEFVETKRNLLTDLADLLSGRVAFEARSLPYAGYETLAAGGLELVPTHGVVEGLRALKDETELEAIRRVAAIGDAAFERLASEPFVGRTERELAWRLEELLHEEGAQGLSFLPVVVAGPSGAAPHAKPGDRPIGAGETVVVDAGALLDGYCSDCTRTFATGELPEELDRAYRVCLEAQLAGLGAVRAGVGGAEADGAARKVIEDAGFGEAFGHGLGHGVGLVVHEEPVLRHDSTDVLAPGHVVSVEPGIYLSGLGGIRIEDLVIVTNEGPEVLTPFTKELTTVH